MNLKEFLNDNLNKTHDEINCYQLVQSFYKEILGITLPNQITDHTKYEEIHNTIKNETQSSWIKIDEPEKYCVLTFKEHPVFVNHIGIYLGEGKFIHSTFHKGVTIERLTDLNYKKRLSGIYIFCPTL